MNYKHLSQVERYQIDALMKAGNNQTQIALVLGRNKATISREVARNTGKRGYLAHQLASLPRINQFAFASNAKGGRITEPRASHARVMLDAGITTLTIH